MMKTFMIYEIVGYILLTGIALFALTKIDWEKRKTGKFKYVPRNYVVLIFMGIGLSLGIYGMIQKEKQEDIHDSKSGEIKPLCVI